MLIIVLLSAVACTKKDTAEHKSSEQTEETTLQSESQEKAKVSFTAKIERLDLKTSTPLIVKVEENEEESYSIPKLTEQEENTYIVEMEVETDHAKVSFFVPPVNEDGSTYEIPSNSIEGNDNAKKVELKLIPKEKVSEQEIKDILDNTKLALEGSCNELTVNEKNNLLAKQVEYTNKADVKVGKEAKAPDEINKTGKESKDSSKSIEAIASKDDPVKPTETTKKTQTTTPKETETVKTTPKKTEKTTTTPEKTTTTTTTKPTPNPTPKETERKKVWVEPVYKTVDVYETVNETYYETVEKQVTEKVLVSPERTEKKERYTVAYRLLFYDNTKWYTQAAFQEHVNKIIDDAWANGGDANELDLGYTLLTENIEGPLPFACDWYTDISETITIPAEYKDVTKTVTEQVPKTRTVKKKVGTKQELVKEGYWKYE